MILLALLLAAADPIRLEATTADLKGGVRIETVAGKSVATNWVQADASMAWSLRAKRGLYRAKVEFRTPGGPKGFQVVVNDSRAEGMLPGTGQRFGTYDAGLVELKDGENRVGIGRGWGYFDIAALELHPSAPIRTPKPVLPRLATPKPSPEAKRLMERLARGYGKQSLSGTYGQAEDDFLAQATGRRAAILGGDFMDYSPSRTERGADPKHHTEEMIAAAKKGKIITMSWHWNAPKDLVDTKTTDAQGRTVDRSWYRGFYTEATTFDVRAALEDPSSEGYRLLIRDIDVISAELKKFQAAKVPVLWRPLHEAEGAWFWWGAKGPEPCKKLWRILYERMVRHHKLDNLIWVWNSEKEEWYPGDDTVDLVTIDLYPADKRDPLAGAFERLLDRFDGKKMLAIAEFPGMMDAARMFRFGARWAYFVSWTGDLGPRATDPAVLKQTMGDRRVVSLPR